LAGKTYKLLATKSMQFIGFGHHLNLYNSSWTLLRARWRGRLYAVLLEHRSVEFCHFIVTHW